jgi:hypothetical protein
MTTQTGGCRWLRCRCGQTKYSRGSPGRGGEAKGARTTAVDGEVARGIWWLGERLFPVLLASDSGSRFPSLVGNNGGRRWPATWSRAVA